MPCAGRGVLKQVPDAAGEVALETPDRFFGAPAFGPLARDVVLRLGMAAQARDGDAVDGRVDLAVAAAVEPVAVGFARADRDRRDAGAARSPAANGSRPTPSSLAPTSLGAVSGPNPGSQSRCVAIWATKSAISASRASIDWLSSRMRRSSSRAIRTRIVCSVRASRRAIREAKLHEIARLPGNCRSGQRSCNAIAACCR